MKSKLVRFLRSEMRKINLADKSYNGMKNKFSSLYFKGIQQAKFDLLMDIDIEFKLGAFVRCKKFTSSAK